LIVARAESDFSDSLIEALRRARHLVAFTGAGVSAESGIPTFRDAQTGLWARFRPEELATPEAFHAHPKRVWQWYASRREQIARVKPNAGHRALVEIAARVPRFTLITQNVDGLHRAAGSRDVIELHGNIMRNRCSAENVVIDTPVVSNAEPPPCPHCGAPLRPDVVWFGEFLPIEAMNAAEAAANECDVFFSIGTSTQVYPAAELPFTALRAGAMVVEINKDSTPLTEVATFSLRGASGEILPRLLRAAWPS